MSLNKTLLDSNTLLYAFHKQVQNNPDAPALRYDSTTLTYREFDNRINQLANHLVGEHHVKSGDLIGIHAVPSVWTVVSIFASLKIGAVFVPLDPAWPTVRLNSILDDASIKLVLSGEKLNHLYPSEIVVVILSDKILEVEACSILYSQESTKEDMAYVIYTSGSTGKPKGVLVQINSLSNYVRWANHYYFQDSNGFSMPLLTSLAFDLTLTSIFCPLTRGATLQILDAKDISRVLDDVFQGTYNIHAVKLTPTHISILNEKPQPRSLVSIVILGGEKVNQSHVDKLRKINPDVRIFNEYGPTETTIGSLCTEIPFTSIQLDSIGKPIANTVVELTKVLKQNSDSQGEILIGGSGLAVGYLNDPEKTDSRFIVKKNGSEYSRFYYTGDLGAFQPDGTFQFLGRLDDQIKINGFRIEPREIELCLVRITGGEEAFVTLKELNNEQILIAYIQGVKHKPENIIIGELSKELPDYMIPQYFIWLDSFPITTNGKLDKKSLPLPSITERKTNTSRFRNSIDEFLVLTIEKIFPGKEITVDQNILSIGFSSLKIIRLFNAVNKEFPGAVKVSDFYNYSTIERISDEMMLRGTPSKRYTKSNTVLDKFEI